MSTRSSGRSYGSSRFPLILLTLGLFSVIVNALLLELTDALTDNLTIDSFFWSAIWAAIVLAIVSLILDLTVGRVARRELAA